MVTSTPSRVEIVFTLRDEDARTVILPAEQLRAAISIFELFVEPEPEVEVIELGGLGLAGLIIGGIEPEPAPGEEGEGEEEWQEIDYNETNVFVQTAENLELEVVFALDFTNSMAQARLPDGRSGIEVMLDAFNRTVDLLPGAHRIGVVEFHDRGVEPRIVSRLTTDRAVVLREVAEFAESQFEPGSSRMWDSIQTAATLFTSREDNPNVVTALVFIFDGRDTSSISTRSDAGELATESGIQLHAMGIGDVFEEDQLSEMILSTGGVYYPVRELEELEIQPRLLVGDLRGQYRVSYTTLRSEGLYKTRVQVDLPLASGTHEGPEMDVADFYGLDTQGRIGVDPPSVDSSQGQAQIFVRALYVPRNISRFRFRVDTAKPLEVALVPREDGGLLEGWTLSGPSVVGFYEATGGVPIEFGNSGLLFQLTLSQFVEQRLDIPIVFDNAIYPQGKSFTYPAAISIGQRVPPSGRIAFRSNRDGNSEIYLMNFDGTFQRNLTSSGADEFLAAWSPDGQLLAFDSDRDGGRDIFVMDADGTGVTNLTNSSAIDGLPAWSPDGQRIAFDSDRDGNREIYGMEADGSDQTRLTNNPGDDYWPTWSPDLSRIAFTTNRDGNFEIYVMNADGTDQTNLTNNPTGDFRPSWSPDGNSIVFYSVRDRNREVYIMNADGTSQRNLTNHPADDWYPSWSPAGAHIAFTSFRDGNREIYTMYSDGSQQRNATNHPADDVAPAWGP